jgi:4-azaleucine resistance transporter AzlC
VPTAYRYEFLDGVRAELPIVMGVLPFGMIYGVVATSAGLPPILAQSMSSVVFAGSAQFIATDLFASAAPAAVLLMTTLIVNLRHLFYSASLAPFLTHLPMRWKLLLGYLLTDEAYAVTIMKFSQDLSHPSIRHWYFLGAGLMLWVSWQASTAAGIFLGAAVPASWSLDFALTVTFIGIVVPTLRDRPQVAAAVSAGIVAVATATWPYQSGLVAAAVTGIVVGILFEGRFLQKRSTKPPVGKDSHTITGDSH